MTVVYDLQGTQSVHHGERGIARYVLELAQALERTAPGLVDRFVVNPDLPEPASLASLRAAGRIVTLDDPVLAATSVFHVASPMENGIPGRRLLPPAVRRARAAVVATVYDLIPLVYADRYLLGSQNRAEYGRGLAIVQAADELLAISDATAADVHRLLGVDRRRITTIGAGAGDRFRRATPSEASADVDLTRSSLPGLRAGFLLVPTGIDFRKNVEGMLAAYGRLALDQRRRHQLVIACRVDEAARRRIEEIAAAHGVLDDVLLTGYVSDELLVALYRTTHLVVFPSHYEGFGLPPLEARQCGAPVVCGDNSSLREVIADGRARFDSHDPADIARVVGHVLADEQLRRELIDAPLPDASWDRAAQLTADVYRRLLTRAGRRHPRPFRLGVIARPDDGVAAADVARVLGGAADVVSLSADDPGVVALHVESGLIDGATIPGRPTIAISEALAGLARLTGDDARDPDALRAFVADAVAQPRLR